MRDAHLDGQFDGASFEAAAESPWPPTQHLRWECPYSARKTQEYPGESIREN
jgi:hypothetical protein